jgi:Putative metallopeptidase
MLIARPLLFGLALLFTVLLATEPAVAQSAAPSSPVALLSTEPKQSNPPEAAYGAGANNFQQRIDAAARALHDNSQYKHLSLKYLQGLVEFVSGNTLFVLLHELGHAAITEMGLPVLGRMEDAADSFAALRLIRIGSDFSHRVLIEAAKGWFLADLRDQKTGDRVQFYDEHGLNQQRAYEIVCLIVGSDEEKYKDLAKETKLPESRRDTCVGDYSNAVYSWDLVLKPHLSPPDRPKTEIDAIYGPAQGPAATAQQLLRSVRLLQTVAEHVANDYVWPMQFTLEMQTCGFPNARWALPTHKLTLCYELAADFAELYTVYGTAAAETRRAAPRPRKRKSK